MVRDGLVFKDENGQVIFNQYSFCELVKHLLVELVGISYEEASQTVERSPLAEPVADAVEWRYSAMTGLITGPCFSTMGTVIGGKRVFQRSQRIWMPMKLWKRKLWRNTT
ncbi:hypothetical protein [Oscillibacter sp.]|uniref:hypothetical protein n=1 Tax=Oscillibacter sp. TaxID=1945593 RepID=UPI002580B70D|nr:hypothetical protein [Oscillibacter sp.]